MDLFGDFLIAEDTMKVFDFRFCDSCCTLEVLERGAV